MEQQNEPAVRERLLEAAVGLFVRKGYHATSVREIVEAAGVTKPVLYYWFKSKEGVFHALMEMAVEAHTEVVARVLAHPGTAAEKILLLGEQVLALIRENADVVRLFDAVYYGPREGAPNVDFDALHGEFRRVLFGLIDEGVRAGEFSGDEIEAKQSALLGAFMVGNVAVLAPGPENQGGCGCPAGAMDVRKVLNVVLQGMRGSERKM
jgi:TetR/AcrR family transcriptional regulator